MKNILFFNIYYNYKHDQTSWSLQKLIKQRKTIYGKFTRTI